MVAAAVVVEVGIAGAVDDTVDEIVVETAGELSIAAAGGAVAVAVD